MKKSFIVFTIFSVLWSLTFLSCKSVMELGFLQNEGPIKLNPNQQNKAANEESNLFVFEKYDLSYNSIFALTNTPFSDDEIANRKVAKGWLGINLAEESIDNANGGYGKKQIVIQYVIKNSPAQIFGLKKNDIILKLNRKAFSSGAGAHLKREFIEKIQQLFPESKAVLTILRNNVEREINITLGKKPEAKLFLSEHRNFTNPVFKKESLLEAALKQQKMLVNYHTVANLVKEKASDIISFHFNSDNFNPLRLGDINYLLHNPLNTPKVAREITAYMKKYFNKNQHNFPRLINFAAKKIDVNYSYKSLSKFSPSFSLEDFVNNLVELFLRAASVRKEAFLKLSAEDMDFLFLYSKKFLQWKTGDANNEPSEEEEEKLLRFLKLAQKVDYKKLYFSSQIILHAINRETIALLKQLIPSSESLLVSDIDQNDVVSGDIILNKETEIGRIIIGGPGPTIYKKNAAIIIDMGGHDIYYNNAGSSTLESPLSLVIDISGNDKYISTQPFVQGSGILGTGVLVDLAGDDLYSSGNIAQGIGVVGSGFLIDLDGDDQYFGQSSVQGLGFFGIGFILEGGGNDRYLAERYAQGIGLTKGIGGIIEVEGSDYMHARGKNSGFRDRENSTESYAQGFGFGLRPINASVGASGGIGLLCDFNGNDIYISDYFGQGSSYWYAFGALVDENGDDLYISGKNSQGAGMHNSIGTIIDEKGNDHYISTIGFGQGYGHDFGVGVLVDYNGNDFYKGETLVQGIGNETGIGIFYDNIGNDKYVSIGKGPGVGKLSSLHNTGSIGLFVDARGNDSYASGEKNHLILKKLGWGLFLDI